MTETKLVTQELERFYKSSEPEVFCLTGDWGVGKTFIVNQIYQKTRNAKETKLNNFSYVSLFGCDSLDALKRQIFENQEQVQLPDENSEKITNKASRLFSPFKKHLTTAERAPLVGDYFKALSTVYFSTIRDTIICIDDLERRGQGLRIEDVLGLISYLKEQRRCKVILILNEDALDKADQATFRKLLEKTIDAKLIFAPTADDSVKIALKTDDHITRKLRQHCVMLKINNIRVIKKIERSAYILNDTLENADVRILDAALHTLVLFSWSIYQPDIAPPLEFIFKNRHPDWVVLSDDNEPAENEQRWAELLSQYGLTHIDQFDEQIIEGITQGYFNNQEIVTIAAKNVEILEKRARAEAFHSSWELFHNSLEDNQSAVVSSLYNATKAFITEISGNNFDSTIRLLKALNANEQVADLLSEFSEKHQGTKDYWERKDFGSRDVKTPEVLAIFDEKAGNIVQKHDPHEILARCSSKNGWNPSDIDVLADLTTEDMISLIKTFHGEELRRAKQFLLMGQSVTNPTEPMTVMTEITKSALRAIAKENHINRIRMKWHHNIEP